MESMEWDVVFSSPDEVTVALIRGLLESSGIRVITRAKGLKNLQPIFGTRASGQFELLVPPDAAELARAIIEAPPLPEENEGDE